MSHTSVVLSTAGISYVHNIILRRFYKFVSCCLSSEVPIVKTLISDSLCLAFSSIGYMVTLIKSPLMYLILRLLILSDYIVNNLVYNYSPFESYISSISS